MSFVSDSAMGMSGSDSGGSIQLPLVEQEVIPIDDSSIEEARHKGLPLLRGCWTRAILMKVVLRSVRGFHPLLLLWRGSPSLS